MSVISLVSSGADPRHPVKQALMTLPSKSWSLYGKEGSHWITYEALNGAVIHLRPTWATKRPNPHCSPDTAILSCKGLVTSGRYRCQGESRVFGSAQHWLQIRAGFSMGLKHMLQTVHLERFCMKHLLKEGGRVQALASLLVLKTDVVWSKAVLENRYSLFLQSSKSFSSKRNLGSPNWTIAMVPFAILVKTRNGSLCRRMWVMKDHKILNLGSYLSEKQKEPSVLKYLSPWFW